MHKLLFLLACFALTNAGYIAILGGRRQIASFNETSGKLSDFTSFQTTPPSGSKLWTTTTLKAIDQARARIYFVFEDVSLSTSAVLCFDLKTLTSKQGPFLKYRVRSLHLDFTTHRLFAVSDFEKGVSESALLELDTETLSVKSTVVSLVQFGAPYLASTFDQKRGFLTITMYNFTAKAHYLVTLNTRDSQNPILYSPKYQADDWHVVTIAFDEISDRCVAIWDYNNYYPLKLSFLDRATATFSVFNQTIINWEKQRDSMSDSPVPFAKDTQRGHLLALVTGKSLDQYLALLDLSGGHVLRVTRLDRTQVVGYDVTLVYVHNNAE